MREKKGVGGNKEALTTLRWLTAFTPQKESRKGDPRLEHKHDVRKIKLLEINKLERGVKTGHLHYIFS